MPSIFPNHRPPTLHQFIRDFPTWGGGLLHPSTPLVKRRRWLLGVAFRDSVAVETLSVVRSYPKRPAIDGFTPILLEAMDRDGISPLTLADRTFCGVLMLGLLRNFDHVKLFGADGKPVKATAMKPFSLSQCYVWQPRGPHPLDTLDGFNPFAEDDEGEPPAVWSGAGDPPAAAA
jgi:hypothetical protein